MELPFEETEIMKLYNIGLTLNDLKSKGYQEVNLDSYEELLECTIKLYEEYDKAVKQLNGALSKIYELRKKSTNK